MKKNYIDLYLLPLPKKNMDKYKKMAKDFGKIACEHGALSYREFAADDLFADQATAFNDVIQLKKDEILISAVADFRSRTHRDQVMKKIFNDPRMEKMMQAEPLFDMKKMVYGGFSSIVNI